MNGVDSQFLHESSISQACAWVNQGVEGSAVGGAIGDLISDKLLVFLVPR